MDWESFLVDHNIDYSTRGSNVKRGNLNISCPLCGDDPSMHMGISLEGKGWGCWRNANHSGKKPHGLVRVLLNCSYNQARIIVQQYSSSDPESLDEALSLLQGEAASENQADKRRKLEMRPEFKLVAKRAVGNRFYAYLHNRGFSKTDKFIQRYNIHYATTGKFKDRVIIPIYMDKKLVSWTSRAIGIVRDAPRYLALSEDEGGLVNVFHSIWNWDRLKKGGKLLVISEGPFDALKLDYFGRKYGVAATCTFGTSMSEEQAYLIDEASRRFEKSFLLYDAGATEAIFRAKELLGHTKVKCGFLPEGIEDPGDMSKKEVHSFIKGFLR